MTFTLAENEYWNDLSARGLYLACWGHPRHELIWTERIGEDGA